MAEINFGLIDTQAPARIANALMPSPEQQGAQALQVMQMQQAARQGQVSQMQLQKMKQDAEGVAEFSRRVAKLGGPSDPMEIAQAYLAHPDAEHKKFGLELLRKTQDVAKFTSIMGRRLPGADMTAPPAAPMSPSVALEPGSFGADVAARRAANLQRTNMLPGAAQPPGVNAMAGDNAAQIAFKQQQRDDLIGMGTTQSIAAAKALDADIALLARQPQRTVAGPGQTIYGPDGNIIATVPEATSSDVRTMQQLGYPLTQQGYADFRNAQRPDRLLTPDEEAQKVRIAKANRAPATPAAPVTAAMPDGTVRYVSREEAITSGMTPASAMEGLTPKERQKREAALPAATSAVNGFDTKAESFIKDLIALRDDAGLDQITGPIYGRVGSVSRAGSRAQALYDKIVAKGGFQALQDLRDASKTGGALGNVSNQEGKQLTASFAAIDRRQAAPDVQAAINQAIADIEGARTRTREAYDSTYEYRATRPSAPSKAPGRGVDTSNPLLR